MMPEGKYRYLLELYLSRTVSLVIFGSKAGVEHSLLVHNNLSEILCCVVGGRDKSVRFTLISGANLTSLAGLLHFVMAHGRLFLRLTWSLHVVRHLDRHITRIRWCSW